MLISSQGQEVLKSKDLIQSFRIIKNLIFLENWNFFAGSLQQRLNVVVMNVRYIEILIVADLEDFRRGAHFFRRKGRLSAKTTF